MATSPELKVKFKKLLQEAVPSPTSMFYDDIKTDTNLFGHLNTYLILVHTTSNSVDDRETYLLSLNEAITKHVIYQDRVKTILTYFQSEVNSGNITGYWLYGYKVNPNHDVPFTILHKNHKFQIAKKVFLNGPLKDNEFIQKKGKHYA